MPPKRRRPRRREQPAATSSSGATAAVPAWVAKRGPDYVEDFLARREERRQQRVDEYIDRAPPAVRREGKASVKAWAEALVDEPRLLWVLEDEHRAPLAARRT